MARNEFAKRLKAQKEAEGEVIQRWTAQLCLDCMTLVLNDPDVMGKDRFGPDRLRKIGSAFNEAYRTYVRGLVRCVEASYVRDKMDERLKRIWGDETEPWHTRYDSWDDKGI